MEKLVTFKWDEVEVTVSTELTTGDQLDVDLIVDSLKDVELIGQRYSYRRIVFAEFLTSIRQINGEFPFKLPAPDAPAAELKESFDAFIGAVGLLPAWRLARRNAKKN